MHRFFFLFFHILHISVSAQNGYMMLSEHNFKLSPSKSISPAKIVEIAEFLSQLNKSDQLVRQPGRQWDIKKARQADSINFIYYKKYFNGYYPSLNSNSVSGKIENRDKLLMDNWILQLHFSDRFAIPVIELISNSVENGTCNELDLMNYVVHYMWRNTEFPNKKFYEKDVHALLLPDLTKAKFAKHIEYAANQYLKYCMEKAPGFKYEILHGFHIKNQAINWSGINSVLSVIPFFNNSFWDVIRRFQEFISFQVKDSNALGVKDGTYTLLICDHPYINSNPPFVF
ncbi:MAG: hypothetical protein J0L56_00180 [Chitinophagales bacterium]|nr:hypothetical protein [Chitinophagales bacterium]